MSPMLQRINQDSTTDEILGIICGIVFAALTLAFII